MEAANKFISRASFVFITFGTARVYRWKQSGEIVSNCHKIPAESFTHELLTVDDIVILWENQLDSLKTLYPQLKVVFTISPVRHWKDGAHGNQVSKSVLFLAVEKLLEHPSRPGYFPAYELVMDDLRDYRYYDDDMLHPSSSATNYIWEKYSECYLDEKTRGFWNEVAKITKAYNHRLTSESGQKKKEFAKAYIADQLFYRQGIKLAYDQDSEIRKKAERLRKQLIINKVKEKEIEANIKVDPDDVRNFFKAHKEQYKDPNNRKEPVFNELKSRVEADYVQQKREKAYQMHINQALSNSEVQLFLDRID